MLVQTLSQRELSFMGMKQLHKQSVQPPYFYVTPNIQIIIEVQA